MGRNNESTSIDYESLVYEYLYTYYEEEMINYLRKVIHIYDIDVEENIGMFCCLDKTNKNGILEKLAIVVPKPRDMKSSQIFIHEFKHAIDLYPYIGKYIGNRVSVELKTYEKIARLEEQVFKDYLVKYLSNKSIKQ